MSKINDLIKELCPNGVEKVSLGSLMSRKKEKNFENSGIETVYSVTKDSGIVKSDDLHDFNVYSSNLSNYYILRLNRYAYNPARLNIGSIARLKEDNPGLVSPMYVVFELDSSKIDYEYYEHLLFSNKVFNDMCSFVEQGARFRFDYKNWDKVIIDLPPLIVQKEIVNILNKFKDLEQELQLELNARKSQYEFWRGKLFDFKDKVEYKRLDELFPFIRNGFVGTVTPFFTEKANGIRYLQGTNIHNGIISDNEEYYVTKEFHEKHIKNELKSDDILMVQSGHIGECAVVGEKYKGCNCHALIIMSRGENVLSKFIVHYFHTVKGYNSLNPAITGGTIKHVLAGKIGKIKVPCPPLDVQERIVNILDRFDTLVNDITSGLPAEIELRRKQYEYYRNKLLSFEELSVSE